MASRNIDHPLAASCATFRLPAFLADPAPFRPNSLDIARSSRAAGAALRLATFLVLMTRL